MKFTESLAILILLMFECKTIKSGTIRPIMERRNDILDSLRVHPEFRRNSQFKLNRPDELNSDFWLKNGRDFVTSKINRSVNTKPAKNIILFIGDGMSLTTQSAARMYKGGEEKSLFFEDFPYAATAKTYCFDSQVADSACTATAYLSGAKNNIGTINVNGKVKSNDCSGQMDKSNHIESIAKWAFDAGKSTGLVTTTRVTHASPAGVYASVANRNWENNVEVVRSRCDDTLIDDIAEQLVHGDIGSKLKVVLGGGIREFLDSTMVDEEGYRGIRSDGKNLINEWLNVAELGENKRFVWNKTDLISINASETDYLMGLFEQSDCRYNLDVLNENITHMEPTLSEMVDKAIDILNKNENGFFLFVEGGRIDHAHHESRPHIALDETTEFEKAIYLASRKTSEDDTLIVVSADHSHTLTYAGYGGRGENIFGDGGVSDIDKLLYMTLTYANGPGYNVHRNNEGRVNLTSVDLSNLSRRQYNFVHPGTVPMGSETHAGDDVGVFANGPWAHLFVGTLEQHVIPHFMAYAACIGQGLKACDTIDSR